MKFWGIEVYLSSVFSDIAKFLSNIILYNLPSDQQHTRVTDILFYTNSCHFFIFCQFRGSKYFVSCNCISSLSCILFITSKIESLFINLLAFRVIEIYLVFFFAHFLIVAFNFSH